MERTDIEKRTENRDLIVLRCIVAYIDEHKIAPSERELLDLANAKLPKRRVGNKQLPALSSKMQIQRCIERLRADKLLEKPPDRGGIRTHRSYMPTDEGRKKVKGL